MLHLALTGNVAAGKSTVAELFRGWGATVIDADRLVREVQAPGTPVHAAIVREFGPGVVAPDGGLDRAALRRLVLAHPARRAGLEAIVHPAVQVRRAELLDEARRRGDRVVASDIPLLFESLDPGAFDAVVLVDAPEPMRRDRLMRQRGLDAVEAGALIAAQLPADVKRGWRGGPRGRGPWIIENDGDAATLAARARAVWDGMLREAGEQP